MRLHVFTPCLHGGGRIMPGFSALPLVAFNTLGHLWHKLEDDPAQPRHILTETAVGYRLVQSARA